MAEKTNNFEENGMNIIPLEAVNKVKILTLYDFIRDNTEKIEKEGYGIGLLSKTFGIKKVEIISYLKPVCDLSQKEGTTEVCDVLYNIKNRLMEEDAKKKKPTITELEFKKYLEDERLDKISIPAFSNNESNNIDSSNTKDNNSNEDMEYPTLLAKNEDNDSSFFVPISDDSLISNKNDSYVPTGEIETINEENYLNEIKEEINNNPYEDIEEETSLNFSNSLPEKKKAGTLKNLKKVLIGVSATSFIAGSLLLTIKILFPSNQVNTNINNMETQKITLPSANEDITSNAPMINIPQPKQDMVVEKPIEEFPKTVVNPKIEFTAPKINDVPMINIPQPKQDMVVEKPIEEFPKTVENPNTNNSDIQKQLNLIMSKLEELEKEKKTNKHTVVSNVQPIQTQTQLIEEEISLEDVRHFEKEFKKMKFNGKTLEYKGKIFNEGDSIGNIKIEYIIPDVHIRVWDIKEGYPFVKVIK